MKPEGPVFIVLTSDDKDGTLYPWIIGPFDDLVEAEEFGQEWCGDEGGGFAVPDQGGYAGVIYVCDDTAASPTAWRNAHDHGESA